VYLAEGAAGCPSKAICTDRKRSGRYENAPPLVKGTGRRAFEQGDPLEPMMAFTWPEGRITASVYGGSEMEVTRQIETGFALNLLPSSWIYPSFAASFFPRWGQNVRPMRASVGLGLQRLCPVQEKVIVAGAGYVRSLPLRDGDLLLFQNALGCGRLPLWPKICPALTLFLFWSEREYSGFPQRTEFAQAYPAAGLVFSTSCLSTCFGGRTHEPVSNKHRPCISLRSTHFGPEVPQFPGSEQSVR